MEKTIIQMDSKFCNSCAGVFESLLSSMSSSSDKIFYQYTSFDTFVNGIVKKDQEGNVSANIRLSSLNYMNDPLEARLGHEVFKKVIEPIAIQIPANKLDELCHLSSKRSFESSFTEAKDSLRMWSMYGSNGQGVCFGINIKKLLENRTCNSTTRKAWWAKCLYVNREELESGESAIIKNLNSIYNESCEVETDNITIRALVERNLIVQSVYSFLVALIKNADYNEEKESRLIIFPGNYENQEIKYKLRNDNIMVPYIDVEYPIECIEEVWIGPNQNRKAVRESLEDFLNHVLSTSNHKIKVFESNIAYRPTINVL